MPNTFIFPSDAGDKKGAVKVVNNGSDFYVPTVIYGPDGVTPISSVNRLYVNSKMIAKEPFSGTGSTTKNFTQTMKQLYFVNDGLSDITLIVGGNSFIIKPGEFFDEHLSDFNSIQITSSNVPYRGYGRN